jgi:hypothetical protein
LKCEGYLRHAAPSVFRPFIAFRKKKRTTTKGGYGVEVCVVDRDVEASGEESGDVTAVEKSIHAVDERPGRGIISKIVD